MDDEASVVTETHANIVTAWATYQLDDAVPSPANNEDAADSGKSFHLAPDFMNDDKHETETPALAQNNTANNVSADHIKCVGSIDAVRKIPTATTATIVAHGSAVYTVSSLG